MKLIQRILAPILLLASLLIGASPAAAAVAYYQPTASIAALKAYGAGSAGILHARVSGWGDYDWKTSCPGTADDQIYVSATGVGTGCWAIGVPNGTFSNQLPQSPPSVASYQPGPCIAFSSYLTPAQLAKVAAATATTADFDGTVVLNNAIAAALYNPSSFYGSAPHICLPAGKIPMGSAVELKHTVWITGAGGSGGLAGTQSATILSFPANTTGITVNRYNTLNGGTQGTPTTAADGSVIEDLQIVDAASTWTDPTVAPGIWCRGRCTLHNLNFTWSAGNSIQIIASGGAGGALEGNANEWRIDSVNTTSSTGGYGLYIKGADVNGGTSIGMGVLSAGLGGIADLSFLGNTHIGAHVDGNGSLINFGCVTFGGHLYNLISSATGIGASTTPGTNNFIWYDRGAGSGCNAWSNVATYYPIGSIFADGSNSRTVFSGLYVEVGLPLSHVSTPGMVMGGNLQTQFTPYTPYIYSAFGIGGGVVSYTGMGGSTPNPDTNWGAYGQVTAEGTGIHWQAQNFFPYRLGYRFGSTSGDLVLQTANLDIPFYVTTAGTSTSPTFGRSTGCRSCVSIPNLILGASRLFTYHTASTIPTATGEAQGENFLNPAPVAGSPIGWVNIGGDVWKAWGSAGQLVCPAGGTACWTTGSGSPNGAITAVVGSLYTDTAATGGMSLWFKATGSSNTGWVPIGTAITTIADATSIAVNTDNTLLAEQVNTQAAGTLTISNPTGTARDGQKLRYRIKTTNAQTFAFGTLFLGSTDLSLPTASSGSSKTDELGFEYDSTAAKWKLLAKNFGF